MSPGALFTESSPKYCPVVCEPRNVYILQLTRQPQSELQVTRRLGLAARHTGGQGRVVRHSVSSDDNGHGWMM